MKWLENRCRESKAFALFVKVWSVAMILAIISVLIERVGR